MTIAILLGCFAVLLSLGWKVWQARQADTPSSSASDSSAPVVYDDPDVRQLLASGQKLEAIKQYRARFNTGLKEAKDAVDALEAGQQPTTVAPRLATATRQPASAADTDPEIQRLIANRQLIDAIKRYKELTGLGLKEAKDAVERLAGRS